MRFTAACRAPCYAFVAPWLLATPAPAMRLAATCRARCTLVAPWLLKALAAPMRTAVACCAPCNFLAPWHLTTLAAPMSFFRPSCLNCPMHFGAYNWARLGAKRD